MDKTTLNTYLLKNGVTNSIIVNNKYTKNTVGANKFQQLNFMILKLLNLQPLIFGEKTQKNKYLKTEYNNECIYLFSGMRRWFDTQ